MRRRPSRPPPVDHETHEYTPEVRCGRPKPMKRSPLKKLPPAPGDAASQNVTAISGGNGQELTPDEDASKLPATSEDWLP